jgi:X-Pro dipeptidyl-peptidase
VYAAETRIREDFWVEAQVDSDRDGFNDLVHVEVARTASTNLGVNKPQAPTHFGTDRSCAAPPVSRPSTGSTTPTPARRERGETTLGERRVQDAAYGFDPVVAALRVLPRRSSLVGLRPSG